MGRRDALSPPLSGLYLPNHLGAVMGPVQLSQLSQRLKLRPPGPAEMHKRTDLGQLSRQPGGDPGALHLLGPPSRAPVPCLGKVWHGWI